jgi:hypothetical protein
MKIRESGFGQDTRRHADRRDAVRKISHDSGTSANRDISADAHLLNHRGADTDPTPGTHMHPTGKAGARADVDTVGEPDVMVDAAAGVKDGAHSD